MVDNFFSRIRGKKTQNYIKHKRHIWSFSTLQRAISTFAKDQEQQGTDCVAVSTFSRIVRDLPIVRWNLPRFTFLPRLTLTGSRKKWDCDDNAGARWEEAPKSITVRQSSNCQNFAPQTVVADNGYIRLKIRLIFLLSPF